MPLVGHITYHLVLIFLSYIYIFMFIFLISFIWTINSLKRQIIHHILIPRIFKSKNNVLQRALLNRENEGGGWGGPLLSTTQSSLGVVVSLGYCTQRHPKFVCFPLVVSIVTIWSIRCLISLLYSFKIRICQTAKHCYWLPPVDFDPSALVENLGGAIIC